MMPQWGGGRPNRYTFGRGAQDSRRTRDRPATAPPRPRRPKGVMGDGCKRAVAARSHSFSLAVAWDHVSRFPNLPRYRVGVLRVVFATTNRRERSASRRIGYKPISIRGLIRRRVRSLNAIEYRILLAVAAALNLYLNPAD
jgi:hypothetical protein